MDQVLITNIFLIIVGSFIILLTLGVLFVCFQVYRITTIVRAIMDNAAHEIRGAQRVIGFMKNKIFPSDFDNHNDTNTHRKI